jgi:putative FmdB family regulatory protein
MPLYEYHCSACDHDVEILVRDLESKPNCPECGSANLTKLLSVIGSPVIGDSRGTRSQSEEPTCGRSQCASGCMFGN